MRGVALFLIVALSACASARSEVEPGAQVQTIRVVGSTGTPIQLTTVVTDAPSTASVGLPLEQLWRALPAAYQALGIPVGHQEAATHVIGSPDFKVRRRLASVPLTRYFECGRTQDGPNAETYELHLSVLTQLRPAATGGTTVSTTIQALARPVTFVGEFARCTSTGALEARIVETLKGQVQG